MDYYEILGVSKEASEGELKRAYRDLAKQVHPDKGDAADSERFRAVRHAYETLSDPARRRAYDARLEPVSWTGGFEEVLPLFASPRPRAKPPVHLDIELTPEEARVGGDVVLEVPVQGACPDCLGAQRDFFGRCRRCAGAGWLRHYERIRFRLRPGLTNGATVRPASRAHQSLTARVKISR